MRFGDFGNEMGNEACGEWDFAASDATAFPIDDLVSTYVFN